MNNGTVKSTAFSGKGPVGVNSFGINQNSFAGGDDDIFDIYVIFHGTVVREERNGNENEDEGTFWKLELL